MRQPNPEKGPFGIPDYETKSMVGRSLKLVLLIIISSILTACPGHYNEEDDCNELPWWKTCLETEPEFGALSISITINSENNAVPIQIFKDDFETGQLVLSDTLTTTSRNYDLPEGYYAATAQYGIGTDVILAVDGDEIDFILEEYCEGYCWKVDAADLDLELK